jgi:uncharacterized membrane protein YagU involved in acid resistance
MNKLIKDAIFGAIGGLAGTLVIGQAMKILSKLQPEEDKQLEQRLIREPPPEKLVKTIVEDALGVEIPDETRTKLGQAVQLGYGISWGAIYGVMRNRYPAIAAAGGLPFGVGLSLLGWTVLLPIFNLTPAPHKLPASTHLTGLVSHYAYAATVEGTCELCEAIDRTEMTEPARTKTELRRVS